ncbi:alanine dehydrogenase [Dyadobacter fermentans]|uniref:alanine dehydrogenase n=1 Tax=Dyadobacter fermentans (strain ATCC 700827 / DSM 18053 / CIP 107007 / KCTC 52180 / NS114) TaxID=471854 RepID=C6W6V1_DYAFD|nr:alanine dehydrogenase [Dyadobacter fermentans]ACT96162.1 Alanine dehydrogenase [Dyadobacter fermentans DSM 18053]
MPQPQITGFEELAKQSVLYPQESLMAVRKDQNSLHIGLPREVSLQENRIALTPDAVGILVRNGHEVWVEKDAGKGANLSDHEYSEAGAKIVHSPKEVYQANVILKVEPLVEEEFGYVKAGTTVISALNLPSLEKQYFEKLNELKITGIGYELIEDKVGGKPIIRAMGEIAGSTVLLIAAEYLSTPNGGRGVILGGITGVPPTKIVILGAGTVAEFATRAALSLGADVKVFDKHIYRLQRLKYSIGQNLYTSIIDSETLAEAIGRADVVIGTMRAENGLSPMVVTREMVSQMKPGSVIIDVSIDQGGSFETSRMTTHKNPTFKYNEVIHYCVPNIPSRVAHTASTALSNVFLPFLLQTGTIGGIEEMIYANRWFMKGVYCHKGTLTNSHIARSFNMRYKDLTLLLAARM